MCEILCTLAGKKQHLLTQFKSLSDDNGFSQELTETVTSATSTSNGNDVHQLKLTQKFLPHWKHLFLWVEIKYEITNK